MAEVSEECRCHHECKKSVTNHGIWRQITKMADETVLDRMAAEGLPRRDATLISYTRPQARLFAEHLSSISMLAMAGRTRSLK